MKLHINKDFQRQRIEVFAFDQYGEKRTFYEQSERGTQEHVVVFDPSSLFEGQLKPLISLPFHLGEALIEGIAEYAKNEGISVKEQSNLAGQLKATEAHLEFLQTGFTKLIDHITYRKP